LRDGFVHVPGPEVHPTPRPFVADCHARASAIPRTVVWSEVFPTRSEAYTRDHVGSLLDVTPATANAFIRDFIKLGILREKEEPGLHFP
jgi:hypothetical protein